MMSRFRAVNVLASLMCLTGVLLAQEPPQPANPNQGFLGGRFAPINEDIAEELEIDVQPGVVLVELIPQSPAEKAGLQEKDILKKIDDTEIDGRETFVKVMSGTKPGQTLKLLVLRGVEQKEISVTLGERPKRDQPPATRPG